MTSRICFCDINGFCPYAVQDCERCTDEYIYEEEEEGDLND